MTSPAVYFKSIGDLLQRGKQYHIPKFQREYAWGDDQIDDFIEDLKPLQDENVSSKPPYIFGPMVFVRDETNNMDGDEIFHVVDGQQRLTTSITFIAVIRDILNEMGKKSDAEEFNRDIREKNRQTHEFSNKLVLSKRNDDFFNNYIMKESPIHDKLSVKPDSANKALHNAYKKIYEAIEKEKNLQDDAEHYLIQLCARFTKLFKIIEVTVPTYDQAYKIFVALNDRGLELSQSDLVKNYLLEKCPSESHDSVFEDWMDTITVLDTLSVDYFLRHFWLGRYEKIKMDEIYENLTKKITGDKVPQFVKDLKKYAEIYRAVVKPKMEDWYDDKEIVKQLESLKILNSKVCYIPILVGKDVLSQEDCYELIKMCVTFFFRYKTICGKHATQLENLMISVAENLRNGKDLLFIKKSQFLNPEIYPDDDEFESAFAKASLIDKIAAYVLERLYNIPDASQMQVEHIVPRSIQGTMWKQNLTPNDEEIQSYAKLLYSRLGNMLIGPKIPAEDKKRSYEEKRNGVYGKFTDMLGELPEGPTWDLHQIDERQRNMAKKATQIWRIA